MSISNQLVFKVNFTADGQSLLFTLRGGTYATQAAGTPGSGTVQLQWRSDDAGVWANASIQNGTNLDLTAAAIAAGTISRWTLAQGQYRFNFFGSTAPNLWAYISEAGGL